MSRYDVDSWSRVVDRGRRWRAGKRGEDGDRALKCGKSREQERSRTGPQRSAEYDAGAVQVKSVTVTGRGWQVADKEDSRRR